MMSSHKIFEFQSEGGRTFTLTRFRTDPDRAPQPDEYVLKCDDQSERAVSVTMDTASLAGLMMAIQGEVNIPDPPHDGLGELPA